MVSKGSETLSPATGTAEGSKATALPGYRFVNWTDSEGNEVGTAPEFIPEKVDGAYEGATYYANFDENEAVTINYEARTGGSVDESSETLRPATGTATTAVLGEALAPVQPEVGVLGEALPPEVGVLGESKGPGTGDTAPIAGWSFLIMGAILTLGITAKKRKKEEK